MATYGLGNSSPIENVFSDTPEKNGTYTSVQDRVVAYNANSKNESKRNNLSTEKSFIPIVDVRNYIFESERIVVGMINEIEENLDQVNLDPYSSMELETAHTAVWKDVIKMSPADSSMSQPGFICYPEYLFAEKHLCRSCRALIKEYELSISHSTFGHLTEARKALKYILNELIILKNISIRYLGEEYRDDTEAQIARYFSDWAKAAAHYTKQIAIEITSVPVSIPNAEVDKISKKQATQFQAFFSIKVNSLTTEIQTMLNLIKRDSTDVANTFYNNFLLPAMNVKSKVIEPMMLDLNTTDLPSQIPTLLKEMYVAESAITGNLGAVTADMLERNNQFYKRFEAFIQALRLKRRYVNYIVQLENKAVNRNKILITDAIENIDEYKETFNSLEPDTSERNNLRSSHNDLDDVDGDAHPQYLKLGGGTLSGNLDVDSGVLIAGMNLAAHSHTGLDGSSSITADVIDYESARNKYYETTTGKPYQNLVLTSLEETIKIGGGIEYEATFDIEIDDNSSNTYEFEILYKEIDS